MLGPQLAEELEQAFKKAKIEEAIKKGKVEEVRVHETFKAVQAFLLPAPLDGVPCVADAGDLERVLLWLGGNTIDPSVYDTDSDSDRTWLVGDEGVCVVGNNGVVKYTLGRAASRFTAIKRAQEKEDAGK